LNEREAKRLLEGTASVNRRDRHCDCRSREAWIEQPRRSPIQDIIWLAGG
jgi:hypothetical protein